MMDTFRELAKVRLKKPTTSVQFSLFSSKTMNKNTGLQQYQFTRPRSSIHVYWVILLNDIDKK